MMEIGQSSNVNAEANFFEEDNATADFNGYNYIYDGVGTGIFVPAPPTTEETAQADLVGPLTETTSIDDASSLDKENSVANDITGTTGLTGSTDLASIDDFEIEEDSTPVDADASNTDVADPIIETSGNITKDWSGGYRLEVDITATSQVDDWTLEFDFPYEMSEFYGVELVDNEDGSYTIGGENGNEDLDAGDTVKSIFVVNDNGEDAIVPELTPPDTEEVIENETIISSPDADDTEEEIVVELDDLADDTEEEIVVELDDLADDTEEEIVAEPDDLADDTEEEIVAEPDDLADDTEEEIVVELDDLADDTEEEIVAEPDDLADDTEEEIVVELDDLADDTEEEIVAEPDATGEIIDVDEDFAGDLDEAISSADDGDVILLGNSIYLTAGIKFNKDITIDGQEDTIIDGGGSSEAIFSLYSGASGATIQDLEIVNGNSAIIVNGAANVTLQNLNIHDMGLTETIRIGQNNSGILLDHADGFQVLNSNIYNIGRKAVGINNTDGGIVSGLKIQNINLAAQHAQSFDAGGIKLFNTNEIIIKDNNLSDINGFMIWNDTTNATVIEDNVVLNAGEDFQAPTFNNNVYMAGIYNEKSSNAVVRGNEATSEEYFFAFRATEFSTDTMTLEENNFSDFELNTTDYWVNEEAEKLIALTEDPDEATFDLISDDFFAQANIDDK